MNLTAIQDDITTLAVDATITKGCRLPAKFVIHTVGPVWHGGSMAINASARKRWNAAALAKLHVLTVCLASILAVAVAQAADEAPFVRLSYQPSMQAGFCDTNGKLVTATEVMHLLPHKDRLYAGTSLWMESDPSIPKACQVLVLDSPRGRWRVDREFTPNNLRLGSLKEITFATDANGKRVSAVSMLLAVPDVACGPVQVFCRNDETGDWVPSVLGLATNHTTTRAIGLHRDRVTGIDQVFAGTDRLGVIAGVYDPAAPGHIRWRNPAEFQTPSNERVMAFCNCSGTFYCATSRHIFQRSDGLVSAWKEIYFCPRETRACGIRGLSAVPNPSGAGEVLLFAALSKVRRLDPADGFKETVELDLPVFLTKQLGAKVGFALAAYNEFVPCTMPRTGEVVWLFGFESSNPPWVVETKPPPKLRLFVREGHKGYFAAEARYCIRHARGAGVRYDLAEVADPRQPALVAVRVIAASPFPEDRGEAFYFGGFDCNSVASHNTAWIYRGEMPSR